MSELKRYSMIVIENPIPCKRGMVSENVLDADGLWVWADDALRLESERDAALRERDEARSELAGAMAEPTKKPLMTVEHENYHGRWVSATDHENMMCAFRSERNQVRRELADAHADIAGLKAECDHRDEGIASWRGKCRVLGEEIARLTADLIECRRDYGKWQEAEIAEVEAEVRAQNDAERLDWLEAQTQKGMAPAIVFDDDGHWAVSFCGASPCPRGDGKGYGEDVDLGTFVEVHEWKPTIRGAIDYAIEQAKGGEGDGA